MVPKRGSAITVCLVQKAEETTSVRLGCPVYKLTATKCIICSSSATESIEMIHACDNKCRIVEKITSERIEQELVNRKRVYLQHETVDNLFYMLNVFKI